MKVLLNSFHLNGHTLGFHPQTQKLLGATFADSRFDSGSERVKLLYVFMPNHHWRSPQKIMAVIYVCFCLKVVYFSYIQLSDNKLNLELVLKKIESR